MRMSRSGRDVPPCAAASSSMAGRVSNARLNGIKRPGAGDAPRSFSNLALDYRRQTGSERFFLISFVSSRFFFIFFFKSFAPALKPAALLCD